VVNNHPSVRESEEEAAYELDPSPGAELKPLGERIDPWMGVDRVIVAHPH
jgi:hypothetical protein